MSQLSYNEALEYIEKNNIKVTKKIEKALDKLYPSGHELVHIDEIEEMVEENIETDGDYERAWGPTKLKRNKLLSYKESLVKAKECNIDSIKLHTAQIVSDVFDYENIKPTDEEFEKVCEYICNCATSTDYASTYILALAFVRQLNEKTTIEKALKEDSDQFVERVVKEYNIWS